MNYLSIFNQLENDFQARHPGVSIKSSTKYSSNSNLLARLCTIVRVGDIFTLYKFRNSVINVVFPIPESPTTRILKCKGLALVCKGMSVRIAYPVDSSTYSSE